MTASSIEVSCLKVLEADAVCLREGVSVFTFSGVDLVGDDIGALKDWIASKSLSRPDSLPMKPIIEELSLSEDDASFLRDSRSCLIEALSSDRVAVNLED